MEELDEFGIPIKKSQEVVLDEFGIPVKKKEPTSEDSTQVAEPISEEQSIDSQKESLPQQPIKTIEFGDAGEFVKAYDPYNDKTKIRPFSDTKVTSDEMKEMFGRKRVEFNKEIEGFNAVDSELKDKSTVIEDFRAEMESKDYTSQEEIDADNKVFNDMVGQYNKEIRTHQYTGRRLMHKNAQINDSIKYIEWAEKQEAEYVQKQEKKGFYKERDNKILSDVYNYGGAGLVKRLAKDAYGGALNMAEGFMVGGAAAYAASAKDVVSSEDIEAEYEINVAKFKDKGYSEEKAVSSSTRIKKLTEKGNERNREFKRNLIDFANERSDNVAERTKSLQLINSLGDIRDGNVFDWVAFASTSMAEQIPQMAITRLTYGAGTYAMTTGNMYQQVYNTVVDRYVSEGMSEEEAMDKALEDEGVNKAILHASGLLVAGADFIGQKAMFGKKLTAVAQKKIVAEAIEGMTAKGLTRKMVKGQVVELGTEIAQEIIEKEGTSLSLGEDFGEGFKDMTVEELKNLTAKVLFGNSGVQVYQGLTRRSSYNKMAATLKDNPTLTKFALEQIDAKVSNGDLSKAKGESLKSELQTKISHVESFNGVIPDSKLEEALVLQEEFDNLQEQVETNTTGLTSMLKSKQKEVVAKLEELAGETQETPVKEETGETTEAKPTPTVESKKLSAATKKVGNNSPINEVELDDAITEGYEALEQLDGDKSEDAGILASLIEDEIEKLEAYDNITETQTRKVAEEKTVRTVKKVKRKTKPTREKNFVGKKAIYSNNKGGGGRGVISIVETPDGKEYYVVDSTIDQYETTGASVDSDGKLTRKVEKVDALGQKTILGEVSTVFGKAKVNLDSKGNPVSVTMPIGRDGGQVTIKDKEIAQEFELEQMKQIDFDEQVFEETYIEFVGEEKVEVPKPKTKTTSKSEKSGVQKPQKKQPPVKSVTAEKEVSTPPKKLDEKTKREEAKKVLADLKVKLKKLNNPLGDDNIQAQGLSGDALIDTLFDAVEVLVGLGFDIAEAIDSVVNSAKTPLNGVEVRKLNARLRDKYDEKQKSEQLEVKNIFESNKELSEIGSVDEYSEYVKNIFPDSKVNNIVYHGTNKSFDTFSKDKLGITTGAPSAKLGFFFASSFKNAKGYSTIASITKNTKGSDFYEDVWKPKIDEYNKLFSELSDLKLTYRERKQRKNTLIEKLIEFINALVGKKEITLAFQLQKMLDKIRILEIEVNNMNNDVKKIHQELLLIDSREWIIDEGTPKVLSLSLIHI